MYGPVCSQICGACINSTQCHHINGSCLQGCDPGYRGQKCDEGLCLTYSLKCDLHHTWIVLIWTMILTS